MKRLTSLVLLTAALFSTAASAAPNVVASIKPVHSLVAAVMQGVGEPTLIVKGSASPHTYALRPSDAGAIENADIVFWTGHGMELFLADALETLGAGAQSVELAEASGITLLPVREGGAFEPHDHGGEDHDHEHEHEEGDMHFWLDPANAKLMVNAIAETLATADPDNAATYRSNAETENAKLDSLATELATTLAPVEHKPFVVFHDAYQYFEQRFGLTVAGSVTVTPEVMPGARRIDELKTKITDLGATCVFAEPNFEPAIIASLIEGSPAKSGVLDPEGAALTEGVDLYPTLLRGLASSLVDCLQ